MTMGERIRKYRKEKKLSQKKLAELSGIAEITIRNYEANKYKPKIEQIQKIASALDIPVADLSGYPNSDYEATWEEFENSKGLELFNGNVTFTEFSRTGEKASVTITIDEDEITINELRIIVDAMNRVKSQGISTSSFAKATEEVARMLESRLADDNPDE